MPSMTKSATRLRMSWRPSSTLIRTARAWTAAVATLVLLMPGCASAPCPDRAEELDNPALRARVGSDLVAGTGIVQRYVDSPDSEHRGYDLQITSRVAGLAEADQIMFLAMESPMPNIEPGADVLIVGVRGPRPSEIRAGNCPVLVPIDN